MELLGKNIAAFKKSKGDSFSDLQAYDILIQMLDSIEILHDKGYIHRDIKPTNFVIGIDEKKVYMVDFGLAKVHLDEKGAPITPRPSTEFRGTLSFASLNAHNRQELSRRDDLFSFFFMILDLLNENFPWRSCTDDKDEIKRKKEVCLQEPEKFLLLTTCKNKPEILEILNYIKTLKYEDRPNYEFIRRKLQELRKSEFIRVITSEQDATLFSNLPFCNISGDTSGKEQNNNSSNLLSKIASTNNMSKIESNDMTIKIPNLKKKRRRFSLCGNQKELSGIERIDKKYTKNDYSIITEDNTLLTINTTQNGSRVERRKGANTKINLKQFASEFKKNVKKKDENSANNSFYVPGFESPYPIYVSPFGNFNNYAFPSMPAYSYVYYDPVPGRINYGTPSPFTTFANNNMNNNFVQPRDRYQE